MNGSVILAFLQNCVAITTIQFKNFFITPKWNFIPFNSHSLFPPPTAPDNFLCVQIILDILYEWNHTICSLLCPASFHFHFKVPLCCTIYQYFIPFCLKILYFTNISYFVYPFIQMHLLCVARFISERLYHYFITTNNDLSACFPLASPTECTVHFFLPN